MAGLKDIASVWNNIKEVDLKPIRESATRAVRIAIAGAEGVGKHTLAEQLRSDPSRPEIHTQSTLAVISLAADTPTPNADLVILMVDATRTEFSQEQGLARRWSEAGKNLLVFINKIDLASGNLAVSAGQEWPGVKVISGSVTDAIGLRNEFVPVVLEMLPQQHIALGRQFPLFRLTVANQLINETCFSNAAYSFSTGLAEIVPVLDLPLNLTDMIVLTKSQGFLAYKLGLLVGFSTRWQDYVTEFGGVIGGGFIWRQAARSLVGLIPGWGIIPKVAVAYSGTYVVGHAVLGWYLSGRHLDAKQMRQLSLQAFTRGKEYARILIARLPKRQKNQPQQLPETLALTGQSSDSLEGQPEEIILEKKPGLPSVVVSAAGSTIQAQVPAKNKPGKSLSGALKRVKLPRLGRQTRKAEGKIDLDTAQTARRVCANCGRESSTDARYCQYCGTAFM